jgi:hypothetical protein
MERLGGAEKERMKEELAAFADYGVPREGRRAD